MRTHKSGVVFEAFLACLEEMSRQHERTQASQFRGEWRMTEAAIPGNALQGVAIGMEEKA